MKAMSAIVLLLIVAACTGLAASAASREWERYLSTAGGVASILALGWGLLHPRPTGGSSLTDGVQAGGVNVAEAARFRRLLQLALLFNKLRAKAGRFFMQISFGVNILQSGRDAAERGEDAMSEKER